MTDHTEARAALRELPCPFCEGQPMSPDCGVCGGSGTLPDATPIIRAALAALPDDGPNTVTDQPDRFEDGFVAGSRYERAYRAAALPDDGRELDVDRLQRAIASHLKADAAGTSEPHALCGPDIAREYLGPADKP